MKYNLLILMRIKGNRPPLKGGRRLNFLLTSGYLSSLKGSEDG
jgi:hypothetical protein